MSGTEDRRLICAAQSRVSGCLLVRGAPNSTRRMAMRGVPRAAETTSDSMAGCDQCLVDLPIYCDDLWIPSTTILKPTVSSGLG